MPITLRTSDILEQAAETLRGVSQVARGINRDLYESQRVSQVNEGLALQGRAFQDYHDSSAKRDYEVQIEGMHEQDIAVLPFGAADFATIDKDYQEFVDAQIDYIGSHFTNKDARDELIAHLQMGAIQNRGQLLRNWNAHADRVAKASLVKLIDTVRDSNLPWEEKVARISSRVNELVRTDRLWKDEGEAIILDETAAAQDAHAYSGALEALKAGYADSFLSEDKYAELDRAIGFQGRPVRVQNAVDAAEQWIDENTPFYADSPGKREALKSEVRSEWDRFTREEDAAKDVVFGNLHIEAQSIAQVDKALEKLEEAEYYDGNQKYIWEQRFRSRRDFLLREAAAREPAKISFKDAQDRKADELRAELSFGLAASENPKDLQTMVDAAYYNYVQQKDENGVPMVDEEGDPVMIHAPLISGSHVKEFLKMLEDDVDPSFANGLAYIKGKLKDDARLDAVTNFTAWFRDHPEAGWNDVLDAAKNITDPIKMRDIEKMGKDLWDFAWFDKRHLDPFERTAGDIASDKYTGIAEARKDHLATFNAYCLAKAQQDFPDENIISAFTDFKNYYNGGYGGVVLIDGSYDYYGYRLEEKDLVLYKLVNGPDDEFLWVKAEKPEKKPRPEFDDEDTDFNELPAPLTEEEIGLANAKLEKKTRESAVRLGAELPEKVTLENYEKMDNGRWRIVESGVVVSHKIGLELDEKQRQSQETAAETVARSVAQGNPEPLRTVYNKHEGEFVADDQALIAEILNFLETGATTEEVGSKEDVDYWLDTLTLADGTSLREAIRRKL